MTGSPVSVSPEPGRMLIVGVNWIGDSVMSMPALEAYRAEHPDDHITLLVKPSVQALWKAHGVADEYMLLGEGFAGVRAAAVELRKRKFHKAYIFPNSFRSALVPFMAGIRERAGVAGHSRSWMLTHRTRLSDEARCGHQAYEYFDILDCPKPGTLLPPRLYVSRDALAEAEPLLKNKPAWVALVPGAARGPSKQWPAEYFIEVGKRLYDGQGLASMVLGTMGEVELGQQVADAIGGGAINLAGKTSFAGWLACLQRAGIVLCNDSGGMHVAAALGTPVVAVFGLTDPTKTGPLGDRTRVVQGDQPGHRDIPRDSGEARNVLASIPPERVYAAAQELLSASSS